MERRTTRWTTWVVLATLALAAVFLAQGLTRLVAGAYLEVDPARLSVSPQAARPTPGSAESTTRPSPRAEAQSILRRNMFDSVTGPVDGTPVAEVEAAAPPPEPTQPEDPNASAPPCDGSFRLVATVAASDPDWSFAAITGATGHSMLYRRGMEIEGRRVVAIGWNEVRLQPSGGSQCSLAMFRPPESRTAAASNVSAPVATVTATPATADLPRPGGMDDAALDRGIQRVSGTEFNIDRSLVDRLLLNQAELMRMARILPYQEGGRTIGVKLFGIRRTSVLARLGLENGDVLRTINGYDMSSPDKALEAYTRLRSSDRLTVSVQRRGTPMTLDFNIR